MRRVIHVSTDELAKEMHNIKWIQVLFALIEKIPSFFNKVMTFMKKKI
jgi:hypothetical protein